MTRAQRWTMLATILGSATVFLDGTIVNVALPKIGEELPATLVSVLEGQTYVVSGYLATLAALLVLAGALADFHGRRRVFAIGLAGFGLTSVLCGAAPTLELLAVFRVLQGAAGALLVPGSLSIITAAFEGPARARAFGIWAAATSATAVLGPLVSGVLVDTLSWRIVFFINVPLVLVGLYATLGRIPESRDASATGRFDWRGAAVVAVSVGGLAFGAIRGQERQWQDALAFAALGVGAVGAVTFPVLMSRSANPLVPLSLFRSRRFAVINLSTLLIYGALYVTFSFQSLFVQGALGYSALAAGAVGLPVGLLLTALSARVGALAGRLGARRFLVVGPLLMAAGLAWLARAPASSDAWRATLADPGSLIPPPDTFVDIVPGVLLFGIGISLVVAPLTTVLMSSVPVRHAGLGSAINNAISRVGQPLLSAVIFIVVTAGYASALAAAVPGLDPADPAIRRLVPPLNSPAPGAPDALAEAARAASTDAFHLAALVCAALLVAGAVVNLVGLREPRPGADGENSGE